MFKCATVDECYLKQSSRISLIQAQRTRKMKHLTLVLKKIEPYITIALAISIFIINQTQYIAFCLV